MPSSSLVEVEVWVEVGLRLGLRLRLGLKGLGLALLFRSGGWVVGDLESKANLNSSCS